ncbi:MAG: MBOAT family protein [Congregibacter sp.]
MVFSTTAFLFAFLPAFLLSYALLPWKNTVALVFSLLFFSWGEGSYVLLLLAVIALNYVAGSLIAVSELDAKPWRRGPSRCSILTLAVCLNLATLFYYKYFAFVVSDVFGLPLSENLAPHLPLGISFFIFQSISYLVDVYRRDAVAARSYFDLALYISMFPQLIAGPIVRYTAVAQDLQERSIVAADVIQGLRWFVVGLAYKVLLANNNAEIADAVFTAAPSGLSAGAAWLGVLAYTLQIFFDFAGYSLMAMGLGRVMGFHFPRNFNYPYVSRSITEFWRRWHMSLSSWFRDYLYIPLGGNRSGSLQTYRNLVVVFFLCGLWHGAAWTFVIWGLFHGGLLVLERWGLSEVLARLPFGLSMAYTLLMIMLGWVFFRADSLYEAIAIVHAMTGLVANGDVSSVSSFTSKENLLFLGVAVVMCLPWLERGRWRTWVEPGTVQARQGVIAIALDVFIGALLLGLCSIFVLSGTYNPFIYFRF